MGVVPDLQIADKFGLGGIGYSLLSAAQTRRNKIDILMRYDIQCSTVDWILNQQLRERRISWEGNVSFGNFRELQLINSTYILNSTTNKIKYADFLSIYYKHQRFID